MTTIRRSACEALFFFRPMRKAPRLEPSSSQRRRSGTLASGNTWQIQAQACNRPHAGSARHSERLPHRITPDPTPSGVGAKAFPGVRAASTCRLGKASARAGSRTSSGRTQPQGSADVEGCADMANFAGPGAGELRARCRVHMERHHFRGSRAHRGLDRRRSQGPDDLRRDIGGICSADLDWAKSTRDLLPGAALGSEAASWHDHSQPSRRRRSNLHAAPAAAEDLPTCEGRQVDRRHFRGKSINTLDALRRGLYRRLRWAKSFPAASGCCSRAPTPIPRWSPTGSSIAVGRFPRRVPATKSNTSVCLESGRSDYRSAAR